MNFILTIALTQIIIAFYLLWNDFRKQSPEQFLLALLVVMFTHMATKFTLYVIINNQLLFNYTASSFSLGYGPLMFLYVQSKVSGHGSSRQRLFLHLGPFLAFTVFYGIVVALH
ncbi:hypothetical protein [Roseivirga pacifica]|uniref:hypothetical protein n=1 Tax=Roseivirga pacifica TaxID=1267423 RepID=UPI003BAFEE34